ncbi:MAG: hypothetical protein K9G46_02230 [Flavobacteriales bacterium]|nr:hypothetical protein [Flavobacteriales bacterium]
MIKKVFACVTLIGLISISTFTIAQNKADIDNRLYDKFSKKEVNALSASELDYWTFYIENSFQIVDIPKEKPDAVPAVVSLKSLDKKDINVFKLGFKPHAVARDYFRIEGTDKMVIVLPQSEIDQLFKARSN